MDTECLNIIENGSFKEFINFCINNYIKTGLNESIIEIAARNNNFKLVYSLICHGYNLNDNEKEIIKNIIKNINNDNFLIKNSNENVLGWIHH